MQGFDEKKWFVYIGDHHEGPFSPRELQQRMHLGQVTSESYIWCDGMADWKAMTEVISFQTLVRPAASAEGQFAMAAGDGFVAPANGPMELAPVADHPEVELEEPGDPIPSAEPASPAPTPIRLDDAPTNAAPPDDGRSAAPYTGLTSFAPSDKEHKIASKIPYKLIAFLFVAGGGAVAYTQGYLNTLVANPAVHATLLTAKSTAQPYLLKLADHVPALRAWISPIPAVEDLLPEDYARLQAAARSPLGTEGPRIAFAATRGELMNPVFYIASNLPDGAKIDFYVEGVPDTLLNQLSFSAKVSAVIDHKLGKTEPLKFPDGKPLARGDYKTYAAEAQEVEQPPQVRPILAALPPSGQAVSPTMPHGLKLVAMQTYFFGGFRDATYTARLKEYHDRLRAKADGELNEIRQFAGFLEAQYNKTQADFASALRVRGRLPQRARVWKPLSQKWTELERQIEAAFPKWTPEALQKDYFYGMLYVLIQQTEQAISKLHQTHDAYMNGAATDPKSFEIQVGQIAAAAQTAVLSLKAKIDMAGKITPTPNGMPRKEGL